MPKIEFKNVNAYYVNKKRQSTKALNEFSCEFKNECINVILGYSGSGKTTLIRTITDSVLYDGDILFDGVDVENIEIKDRNLGYVSQNYALYPGFTIFDNIAFPLKNMHAPVEEIKKRVYEVAKRLGIEFCLSRKPRHLSGGQQQRVCLARALVKKPNVILFDEPLSNLDVESSLEARQLIKETLKENKLTALYVTHDLNEAYSLADYIYVVDEGNLVFKGTIDEFNSSTNEVVVSLIKARYEK